MVDSTKSSTDAGSDALTEAASDSQIRTLRMMLRADDTEPDEALDLFISTASAAHAYRNEIQRASHPEVNRSTALWALMQCDGDIKRAIEEHGLTQEEYGQGIGLDGTLPEVEGHSDAIAHEYLAKAWDDYLTSRSNRAEQFDLVDLTLAVLESTNGETEGLLGGRLGGLDLPRALEELERRRDEGGWSWERRTATSVLLDSEAPIDELGRDILATHIDSVLASLLQLDEQTGCLPAGGSIEIRSSAVLHVDGRWGSGKSSLVHIMLHPHQWQAKGRRRRLQNPVVANYNAWRESTVTPEWWSLGAEIVHRVQQSRSLAGRLAMMVTGLVGRLLRARPLLVALVVSLVAALVLFANPDASDTVSNAIAVITAVTAAGILTGQALFWTAPTFGKLHLSSRDSVLEGVASEVARSRRWVPRATSLQRPADTLCGTWVVLAGGIAVEVAVVRWQWPWAESIMPGRQFWWLIAAISGVCAAALWWGCWPLSDLDSMPAQRTSVGSRLSSGAKSLAMATVHGWRRTLHRPPTTTDVPPPREPPSDTSKGASDATSGGRITESSQTSGASEVGTTPALASGSPVKLRSAAALVGGLAVGGLVLTGQFVGWPQLLVLVVLGLLAAVCWGLQAEVTAHCRRPLVVIVDDLDRCRADRVTKLIETVHTLLKYDLPPSSAGAGRSQPAPLAVLILGDGRWIRRAFMADYGDFTELGSRVHDLGADFIQKVFDHTVYVPALNDAQRAAYAQLITLSPAPVTRDRAPESFEAVLKELNRPSGGNPYVARLDRMIDRLEGPLRVQAEAERAALAVTRMNITREHLLTAYSSVMPSNPRLIKRVINAYLMLQAIRRTVQHRENEDTVARSAILATRFPTLASDLISDERSTLEIARDKEWKRSDVRRLVSEDDLDDAQAAQRIQGIAWCLGRTQPFVQEEPGSSRRMRRANASTSLEAPRRLRG